MICHGNYWKSLSKFPNLTQYEDSKYGNGQGQEMIKVLAGFEILSGINKARSLNLGDEMIPVHPHLLSLLGVSSNHGILGLSTLNVLS